MKTLDQIVASWREHAERKRSQAWEDRQVEPSLLEFATDTSKAETLEDCARDVEAVTKNHFVWSEEDPRYHVNKRARIVILYSDATGYHKQAAVGEVDTKEGWYVGISSHNPELCDAINEDDDWPKGWLWAHLPRT